MGDPYTLRVQCFRALVVEEVILIFNGNFVCSNLCLLPLVTSLFTSGKSFCIFFVLSHQAAEDSSKMLQCAFVQADGSQVSHPVLMPLVLQPWLYWLPFTGLAHYVCVFLGLATPPGHSPPGLLMPNRGRTTWSNLLATLLLEQTNVLVVFIVLPIKTPKSFLAKLQGFYHFLYLPRLYYCLVLLYQHWRIWHLASKHFIRFLPALFSKLLKFLHSSSACSILTAPLSLIISACTENLLGLPWAVLVPVSISKGWCW